MSTAPPTLQAYFCYELGLALFFWHLWVLFGLKNTKWENLNWNMNNSHPLVSLFAAMVLFVIVVWGGGVGGVGNVIFADPVLETERDLKCEGKEDSSS